MSVFDDPDATNTPANPYLSKGARGVGNVVELVVANHRPCGAIHRNAGKGGVPASRHTISPRKIESVNVPIGAIHLNAVVASAVN